jgi:hypothetical protein
VDARGPSHRPSSIAPASGRSVGGVVGAAGAAMDLQIVDLIRLCSEQRRATMPACEVNGMVARFPRWRRVENRSDCWLGDNSQGNTLNSVTHDTTLLNATHVGPNRNALAVVKSECLKGHRRRGAQQQMGPAASQQDPLLGRIPCSPGCRTSVLLTAERHSSPLHTIGRDSFRSQVILAAGTLWDIDVEARCVRRASAGRSEAPPSPRSA